MISVGERSAHLHRLYMTAIVSVAVASPSRRPARRNKLREPVFVGHGKLHDCNLAAAASNRRDGLHTFRSNHAHSTPITEPLMSHPGRVPPIRGRRPPFGPWPHLSSTTTNQPSYDSKSAPYPTMFLTLPAFARLPKVPRLPPRYGVRMRVEAHPVPSVPMHFEIWPS